MSDIQAMKEMLTGLESKKTRLDGEKDIFLRVAGMNEEIERANQDKSDHEKSLAKAKLNRDKLKKKKADAVSKTTEKITEKMNSVLPFGEAVFSYDEDEEGKRDLHIGWKNDNVTTPYNGLSGAEKQMFDAALANVLDANIIVLEAAELDPDNLFTALCDLGKLDAQVIVNTWCDTVAVLPPFVKIDIGETNAAE